MGTAGGRGRGGVIGTCAEVQLMMVVVRFVTSVFLPQGSKAWMCVALELFRSNNPTSRWQPEHNHGGGAGDGM